MSAHPQTDFDKLMFSMRRALVERRHVIDIGKYRFRFQRKSEEFEDEHGAYQALQSGVYAYFPATAGGVTVPGRWVHLGSSYDLEDLMRPYLHHFAPREFEELRVTISANAALQSLVADRRAARAPAAPASTSSSLLFTPVAPVPGEFAAAQYEGAAAPVRGHRPR